MRPTSVFLQGFLNYGRLKIIMELDLRFYQQPMEYVICSVLIIKYFSYLHRSLEINDKRQETRDGIGSK
ncbi:hypothetical protein QLX08_005883 [Tetragonisca angustula]|uniref:Uncharacterized protein n=1 Tax=Tetragonisca angustula TaxID=166442 RepID=A0AAW0ZW43_9HYME